MNRVHFNILIVLIVVFMVAATACSVETRQADDTIPPYYGAFIKDGGDLTELTESVAFGVPRSDELQDVPLAPDSQPIVVLWKPDTQLQYLQLFATESRQELRYNAVPKQDGIIELSPVNPLANGRYCYIQGNPLGMGLPAWCFQVGPNPETASMPPATLESVSLPTPTSSPQSQTAVSGTPTLTVAVVSPTATPTQINRETVVAQAMRDVTEGANVATIAAAEQVLIEVSATIAAQVEARELAIVAAATATRQAGNVCSNNIQGQLRENNYSAFVPNADLSGCNLSDQNLLGLDLRGGIFVGTNFSNANLTNVDLGQADLRYADLRGANLDGTNLQDANLTGALLRPIDIMASTLLGNNIRDATIVLEAAVSSRPTLGWSPDGVFLAMIGSGQLHIWNSRDMELVVLEFEGIGQDFAWAPDSRRIATGGSGLFIIDVLSKELLNQFKIGRDSYVIVGWDFQGEYIFGLTRDFTLLSELQVWNANSGEQVFGLSNEASTASQWHPNKHQFLARNGIYSLNDLTESGKPGEVDMHWANLLGWDPSGKYLVAFTHNDGVRLFDSETGDQIIFAEGHNLFGFNQNWSQYRMDYQQVFSADGTYIATFSESDSTIYVWDIESEQSTMTLSPFHEVHGLAWNKDGNLLAFIYHRVVARRSVFGMVIWDVETNREWAHIPMSLGQWHGTIMRWDPSSSHIALITPNPPSPGNNEHIRVIPLHTLRP